jgi:quercetin dioxygenase-like cupin family protein
MANYGYTRRSFLQKTPLLASSLPLADMLLFGTPMASAQAAEVARHGSFQLLTAQTMHEEIRALQSAPGNKNLLDAKGLPVTMVLTSEEKKIAKEFEYHAGRDHIVQVLEGSTLYEVGGVPSNPRQVHPEEWLAPASEGATKIVLKQGDTLILPRGTPHKRSTEASVTLVLISTTGPATAS